MPSSGETKLTNKNLEIPIYEQIAAGWYRGEQTRAEAEAGTEVTKYNFKLSFQFQTHFKHISTFQTHIHTTSLHSAFLIIAIIVLSGRPSNEDEEYRRMRDRYEEE